MSHTCPECGSLCHCCGDIDDVDFGERSSCKHYLSDGCSFNDVDDEDIQFGDEPYEPPPLLTEDPNQLNLFNENDKSCPKEKTQKRVPMHIVR
jgi:hypothetical protein